MSSRACKKLFFKEFFFGQENTFDKHVKFGQKYDIKIFNISGRKCKF